MSVIIIAAVARDNAIGRAGDLLWHLPADLKHFKALTSGSAVVMGRKTWESLPKRPLPKRRNIVVSRNVGYQAEGAEVCQSLEDVLTMAGTSSEDVYIIGGGQLYAAAMPEADILEITEIDADAPDADTFFPEIKEGEWKLVDGAYPADADANSDSSDVRFCFKRYERVK